MKALTEPYHAPHPHGMLLPVSAEGMEPSPIFVTCPIGAVGDVTTRPTLPSELNASDQSLLGEERAASQASSLNYTEQADNQGVNWIDGTLYSDQALNATSER